jgi:hypothetical protein
MHIHEWYRKKDLYERSLCAKFNIPNLVKQLNLKRRDPNTKAIEVWMWDQENFEPIRQKIKDEVRIRFPSKGVIFGN